MKKIFLMRHSIPEKGDMPNEQIPLSEEGKALAVSKRNIFSNVDRCFSSPYRRAMETAEFIADHPVIVKELHERTIGDAREDFWLKQYEDHDFRNPGLLRRACRPGHLESGEYGRPARNPRRQ